MPQCVLFWCIYPAWYNLSFLGLWFRVTDFANFSAIIFSNIFCLSHSCFHISWHPNKVFVRLSDTIPQPSDGSFLVFFCCWFYFFFSLCFSLVNFYCPIWYCPFFTSFVRAFLLNHSYFKLPPRGAWVAQRLECPTLGFSSSHDLIGHEIEPRIRFGVRRVGGQASLFEDSSEPPHTHTCMHSLSLSQINKSLDKK